MARRPSRLQAAVLGLGALAAVGAAARTAQLLGDGQRRERLRRSQRVWRLTARRGAHWAAVKVRGSRISDEARAELEQRFAIRTAEDVARELGNMKGAIMKLGQMVSFIAEGLPPEAQAALATLQADAPAMAPSLAEQVIREELGAGPEGLFLDWDPVPVAAASIGQVHRAVLKDGRLVAVKVQYPGVDEAIRHDLDNAETLYGLFSAFSFKNMDVTAIVDELRDRMGDELDYRLEARCQADFAERYATHPFIHVPPVVAELSTRRVLTSDWVDGQTFAEFERSATGAARQTAAEVLFRFAQGSIHFHRVFNGDPHPGNYRFHDDGSITFLDFGLVKRWAPGEMESLAPILDDILAKDSQAMVDKMVQTGFLDPGHGLDPDHVWEYVSAPYRPYLDDEFEFTREFVSEALGTVIGVGGPYKDVIAALDMPSSFVILDRVVWGITALLGKLNARGPFRRILDEYRHGAPPATELGLVEARWRAEQPPTPSTCGTPMSSAAEAVAHPGERAPRTAGC